MFLLNLDLNLEKEKARVFATNNYKGERTLSLTAQTFGDIPKFLNQAPEGHIDCVEIDTKTYLTGLSKFQELKKQFPEATLNYINTNVFNMDFSKYQRLNLDFCGVITNTLIFNLTQNLANFNGVVYITLKKREQVKVEHFGASSYQEFRDVTFPQIIQTYTGLSVYKPRYDYINGRSSMMVYSFIRK